MQRRLTLTLLCAFLLPATSWAAPGARALRQAVTTMEPAVPVFISGRDGYRSFRIPAIVRLPGGDLLAFADGRVDGAADFGDVKIVMKRSHDGGRTWSALKVVASNDSLQADNAAPVLDRLDPAYPQGRLFLFYDTGDKPEQDIRHGVGHRDVWYITSVDGGHTWSSPAGMRRTTIPHCPIQRPKAACLRWAARWTARRSWPSATMPMPPGAPTLACGSASMTGGPGVSATWWTRVPPTPATPISSNSGQARQACCTSATTLRKSPSK